MSLILRADIDKPYGNNGLIRRIASKLTEDYFNLPFKSSTYYLHHVIGFLEYCNVSGIKGYFYFRNCTTPSKHVKKLLFNGYHKIGFHAEDTRSIETFSAELKVFKETNSDFSIESFSKHGSGRLKLGKHHYPPYEPEKYKVWATSLGIKFYFGNLACEAPSSISSKNGFFENVFFIEREYRSASFFDIQSMLDVAINDDVVVIIHPCNFNSSKVVAEDFKQLVRLAKEQNISWRTF